MKVDRSINSIPAGADRNIRANINDFADRNIQQEHK
jgi:hypothetical protein